MKNIVILLIFLVSTSFMPKENQDFTIMENQLLELVNNYRSTKQKSRLVMNEFMRQEARTHSENMAQGKVGFGHAGASDRSKRISKKVGEGYFAENVAYNESGNEQVVQQWIESSGHRKNMEGKYLLSGIGIAKKGKIYYFTQVFLFVNRK